MNLFRELEVHHGRVLSDECMDEIRKRNDVDGVLCQCSVMNMCLTSEDAYEVHR